MLGLSRGWMVLYRVQHSSWGRATEDRNHWGGCYLGGATGQRLFFWSKSTLSEDFQASSKTKMSPDLFRPDPAVHSLPTAPPTSEVTHQRQTRNSSQSLCYLPFYAASTHQSFCFVCPHHIHFSHPLGKANL